MKLSSAGGPALRLLLILCGTLFASEMVVMWLLDILPPLSPWGRSLLDATLLSILIFPVVYFFGFRPLRVQSTVRQRAEAFQQEALDRLQKIANRVPGLVYQYRLRPDGTACLPFASEAIREVFRVSPEDVREDASPIFARIHPDDSAGVGASIQQSARDLTPWQHAFRVKFDDGTVRILYADAVSQREADGSVLWHGFVTDITARQRAEDKFRQLSTAVEQNPASIVITDLAGKIEYANPKFIQVTGYTLAEVLGQNPRVLKSGDKGPEAYAELWQTLVAGQEWRGEFHNKKKNGELYWESASISPIRDAAGATTHYVAVKEDITARKQVEEALHDNEAMLRKIMAAARDAIVLLDHAGRIALWNEAAERMFGFPVDAALGRDFHALLAPARYHEAHRKAFAHFQGTGEGGAMNRTLELWAVRQDGSEIPVELSLSAVQLKGQWHGLGIVRDISQRKKTEAERELLIKSLEEALASVKTLSGLVPICAHCKKIRDDQGFWSQVESYVGKHTDAKFSHGICPECTRKFFPDEP